MIIDESCKNVMTLYETRPNHQKESAELAYYYKTSMVRHGQQRSGRLYPHQRDTNDDVPILGADVEIFLSWVELVSWDRRYASGP